MTNRTIGLITLLLVLGASLMPLPAFAYQGILNGPGAFQVFGTWQTTATNAAMTWDIQQDTAGFFHYNYRTVVPDGAAAVNTFILEIPSSVTAADIFDVTGNYVVGDFLMADYPNLPRDIHGIAWVNVDEKRSSYDFNSYKSPIWGDFYVESDEDVPSSAFNTGFTNPSTDPTDPPSDGTIDYHILTVGPTAAVPDASTIVLACFGALQLLAVRKKIFR